MLEGGVLLDDFAATRCGCVGDNLVEETLADPCISPGVCTSARHVPEEGKGRPASGLGQINSDVDTAGALERQHPSLR